MKNFMTSEKINKQSEEIRLKHLKMKENNIIEESLLPRIKKMKATPASKEWFVTYK